MKYKLTTEEIELPQRYGNASQVIEDFLIEAKILIPVVDEWPKVGDKYWYVSHDFIGSDSTWCNDSVDNFRKATGNYFRTEQESIAYAEELKKRV